MLAARVLSHALPLLGFAILAAGSTESSPENKKAEPIVFDEISAKVYCENTIKKLLRDPDSYQFESASVVSSKEATINFRSKNGLGGYVPGVAKCTTHMESNENIIQAQILD